MSEKQHDDQVVWNGPEFTLSGTPRWYPTNSLRFVMRDDRRILQQAFQDQASGDVRWEDVPLVEEESDERH